MLNKISAAIFAIAIICSASGCTTLADARTAKGSGVSRTYAVSEETVWAAVPPVLAELGLSLAGENKQEGYILAQRGMTAFSYGENVAIFVESVNGVTKTRVEVVSKKAMSTNIFAPSWENDILNKLDEKLKSQSNIAAGTETVASTAVKSPIPALASIPSNTLPSQNESAADKLRDLNALYKDGVISKRDFETKKQEILKTM